MDSFLTDQDRKELKRLLVQGLNKELSLCHRAAILLLGLVAVFNPGLVITVIGIHAVKNFPPGTLEMFTDLAQAED